jgi:O-acetyl-ADP-ribose deacetylase (regulator of RNase III)
VIRVPVPIDVGTSVTSGASAFACATPLRVDRLIALAIREALGKRAPLDKRERSIRRTMDAFAAGEFVVDVDGRLFDRPDAVVVCAGVATLRFFSTERGRRPLRAR